MAGTLAGDSLLRLPVLCLVQELHSALDCYPSVLTALCAERLMIQYNVSIEHHSTLRWFSRSLLYLGRHGRRISMA